MKRAVMLLLVLLSFSFISAVCTLTPSLVNQDPYPAIPGESVKLVFQLDGLSNSECGEVSFEIVEKFPFSVLKGYENPVNVNSGFYQSTFPNYLLASFEIEIDKDSLEGDIPLTVRYTSDQATLQKDFNINIKEVRTDFEINIKSYDTEKKELTLEVLNIGKSDVEAVTLQLVEDNNFKIYGSDFKILGDVDTTEDELVTFIGDFNEGEMNLVVQYTDSTLERRRLDKKIYFNEEAYKRKVKSGSGVSSTWAFIIGIILPILFFYLWRIYKKRKESRNHIHRR